MAYYITLLVNDEQFNRAVNFGTVFGHLMINIGVMLAPMDTGNLRRSITLTKNNERRKQIRYNTMSANYLRFLENGDGPVKKHKGFISVDTTTSIVEGISNIILTGNYPFLSFSPNVELKDTGNIFSKERQILRSNEIKTDRINANIRRRISQLRESEYRNKIGMNKFGTSGKKINTTTNFSYGSNKGSSVLSKAYKRNIEKYKNKT